MILWTLDPRLLAKYHFSDHIYILNLLAVRTKVIIIGNSEYYTYVVVL